MYHEEKLIDDVLHFRGTPDGTWMRYTIQQLSARVVSAEKEAAEWKRRAASHGCDTENGDPDCG